MYEDTRKCGELNPFRAPEPLPILNPSNFVPKNGSPFVKGLIKLKCIRVKLTHGMYEDTRKCGELN